MGFGDWVRDKRDGFRTRRLGRAMNRLDVVENLQNFDAAVSRYPNKGKTIKELEIIRNSLLAAKDMKKHGLEDPNIRALVPTGTDYGVFLEDRLAKLNKGMEKVKGKPFREEAEVWRIRDHMWSFIIGTILSVIAQRILINLTGRDVVATFVMVGGIMISLSFLFPEEGRYYKRLGGSGTFTRVFLRWIGFILLSGMVIFFPVGLTDVVTLPIGGGMGLFGFNSFVGLIALWIGFLMFPTKIYDPDGNPSFEGPLLSLRFLMGYFIIAMFLHIMGGTGLSRAAVGFVAAGFFMIFPDQAMTRGAVGRAHTSVAVFMGGHENFSNSVSAMLVFIGWALGTFALFDHFVTMWIWVTLGFGAFMIALTAPPTERTIAGTPIVLLLIFTLTTAYPSLLGEAVFGPYWPQAQAWYDNNIAPAVEGLEKSTNVFKQGYTCLVDPIGCSANFTPGSGTAEAIKAVEITKLEVIGTPEITQIPQSVSVLVEVSNLGPKIADGVIVSSINSKIRFRERDNTVGFGLFTNCPNPIRDARGFARSCRIDRMFPEEIRQLIINYTIINGFQGGVISYGADVNYTYAVNASMDVTIIDADFYEQLLLNNRLSALQKVAISRDTGGPVRLGLAILRNQMPIRDDIGAVPVELSLQNMGTGTVKGVFEATLFPGRPDPLGTIRDSKPFCSISNGEFNALGSGTTIGSGADSEDVCVVAINNIETETKTSALTGSVVYNYNQQKTRKDLLVTFEGYYNCKCAGESATYPLYNCEQCVSYCENSGGKESCNRPK